MAEQEELDLRALKAALIPIEQKEFRVTSGKILVADPDFLGYPREILHLLDKFANADQFWVLSHGLIYTPRFHTTFEVYQNGDEITIIDTYSVVRGESSLFAIFDSATILIGDAEVFGVKEHQIQIPHNPYLIPTATVREVYQQNSIRDAIKNNQQILKVKNGLYVYHLNEAKDQLSVKPFST